MPTDGAALPLSISRDELLVEGHDTAFRDLIQGLFSVASRMQTLRERIGAIHGISGPQYGILMAIMHNEGRSGVSVNGVAAKLHVRANFVTTETNKLRDLGLLRKRDNPADRRSVLLSLTPKGRALVERLLPIIREVNDEIFRGFDREDFGTLSRLVGELIDSLDDARALLDRRARRH